MNIEWKKIELSDKDLIKKYYACEHPRMCDFTFANNYLWAPFYNIRYAVLDGFLLFRTDEEHFSVSFPMGEGDTKKTIDHLMEYFHENGKKTKMHLVSEEQFQKLEQWYPEKFQVEYNRDRADYIYETEAMITLAGKKLHGKRNHINKFKENNPEWRYESLDDTNMEACLKMAERWKTMNGCDENDEKHQEMCVTIRALQYYKELELEGGMIWANDEVVAFTIGEPCNADTFVVHIEKAFAEIQGAYPIINQQFLEHIAQNYRYVNREEDTGSEGLRKAKLSYNPVFLMEKGVVMER